MEPGLSQAVAALPERQRTVVLLLYSYEWTQLEVAEVLGISNSSVQRHSERAIARLRRVRRDPECPACAEENKPPRLVEYDIACAHPGSVARIA